MKSSHSLFISRDFYFYLLRRICQLFYSPRTEGENGYVFLHWFNEHYFPTVWGAFNVDVKSFSNLTFSATFTLEMCS